LQGFLPTPFAGLLLSKPWFVNEKRCGQWMTVRGTGACSKKSVTDFKTATAWKGYQDTST